MFPSRISGTKFSSAACTRAHPLLQLPRPGRPLLLRQPPLGLRVGAEQIFEVLLRQRQLDPLAARTRAGSALCRRAPGVAIATSPSAALGSDGSAVSRRQLVRARRGIAQRQRRTARRLALLRRRHLRVDMRRDLGRLAAQRRLLILELCDLRLVARWAARPRGCVWARLLQRRVARPRLLLGLVVGLRPGSPRRGAAARSFSVSWSTIFSWPLSGGGGGGGAGGSGIGGSGGTTTSGSFLASAFFCSSFFFWASSVGFSRSGFGSAGFGARSSSGTGSTGGRSLGRSAGSTA